MIEVFEDAYINPNEITMFMDSVDWKFGWRSNIQTDNFSFFNKRFAGSHDSEWSHTDVPANVDDLPTEVRAVWEDLKTKQLEGHTLIRCYANGLPYGCDGTWHLDTPNPHSYTAVYFPIRKWDVNWAGETVFLNEDKTDIIKTVLPKKNRLIVFNGNIPHLARGVERTCPILRITLMFKTVHET